MVDIPLFDEERVKLFKQSANLQDHREGMDQSIDVAAGPEALTVMGIRPALIFCSEAWPHTDPDWNGRMFFTLTVEGFMYSFGCLSTPTEVSACVGKTLLVNPMELHWLRPDPVVSTGWLALQWDVAVGDVDAFAQALATAIQTWNEPSFELPALGE